MSENTDPQSDIPDSAVASGSIEPEALQAFLMTNGLENLKCELCGGPDWVLSSAFGGIADTMAQTVVSADKHGFVGSTRQPFVFIFCTNCGNTKMMNAALINARLKPCDPTNKQLVDQLREIDQKGRS
ncbi:hypothetical protein [Pseudomonas sp. NBRC 111128]|uniref:hypothetical protein n=1 Tax=Pseudomonas sp. NBRC 111128 TaxID=1661043 RepID=UPI0006D3F9F1|nr:hypothetical protein [Pseudomonas sp. NBRC 111128]